jgi:hypothetical protein
LNIDKNKGILLKSIVVSYVIAMLLFIVLVSFAPDSTPYSLNNYGWNGMHQLSTKYDVKEINSISQVPPSNKSVLLELAPSNQFSNASGQIAKYFVENGGTLIIADSSGFSNSLLRAIGAQILVSGDAIYDPVYNWKQKIVPLVLTSNNNNGFSFLNGVTSLAMSNASSILIQGNNAITIAYSSPQSEAINSSTNAFISKGPFPMAAVQNVGRGKLIVIADSSFFLNSVWANANNEALANNLLQNSTVYLDTSAWPINSQTTIKAGLASIYSSISATPYRYIFAISFVGLGLLVFQVFTSISSVKVERPKEVRSTTFNNEILRRVRRDREKYGTATGAGKS